MQNYNSKLKKYYSSSEELKRRVEKHTKKFSTSSNTIFIVFLLIFIALVERLWLDMGPNVELVTVATFIAGFYLGKKWALIVPLIILAVSDIFLGNTNIMLFTWSGFIVISLISQIGLISKEPRMRIFFATTGGVAASIWFFIWTNFGVWFLDSWGMYERNLSGLLNCYINGIPFMKYQLFSNLIIIPVAFIAIEVGKKYYFSKIYTQKPALD